MAVATKPQILNAARRLLRPVVFIALQCGISFKEFNEVLRLAFVEVATERFGKRGRPTNVSRVALMTGMTRRDVRALRERLDTEPPLESTRATKESQILARWHDDPEFRDDDGDPALLSFEDVEPSFATLARRCGATDVPAITLLRELKMSGAVEETDAGRLRAVRRGYLRQSMDEAAVLVWGTHLSDLGVTLAHNLARPAGDPARFERAASVNAVDPRAVDEFRSFLEREGQGLLERADAWLTARAQIQQDDTSEPRKTVRLGVGVYHIQD